MLAVLTEHLRFCTKKSQYYWYDIDKRVLKNAKKTNKSCEIFLLYKSFKNSTIAKIL